MKNESHVDFMEACLNMCDKHIKLNGCKLYVLNMIIHDTWHEV